MAKNKMAKMFSEHKKLFLILGLPMLGIGLVAAAWFIGLSDNTQLQITSDEPVLFSSTFSSTSMDVTDAPASKTEEIGIDNVNSQMSLNIVVDSTFTDDSDDNCTEEVGDWNINATYVEAEDGATQLLTDGSDNIVNSPNGLSQVIIETNAIKHSCAGNISSQVDITEYVT